MLHSGLFLSYLAVIAAFIGVLWSRGCFGTGREGPVRHDRAVPGLPHSVSGPRQQSLQR